MSIILQGLTGDDIENRKRCFGHMLKVKWFVSIQCERESPVERKFSNHMQEYV